MTESLRGTWGKCPPFWSTFFGGISFDRREIVEAHRWLQKLLSFFFGMGMAACQKAAEVIAHGPACQWKSRWRSIWTALFYGRILMPMRLHIGQRSKLSKLGHEGRNVLPRVLGFPRSDVALEIHWFTHIQSKLRRICKLVNHDPWFKRSFTRNQ